MSVENITETLDRNQIEMPAYHDLPAHKLKDEVAMFKKQEVEYGKEIARELKECEKIADEIYKEKVIADMCKYDIKYEDIAVKHLETRDPKSGELIILLVPQQ